MSGVALPLSPSHACPHAPCAANSVPDADECGDPSGVCVEGASLSPRRWGAGGMACVVRRSSGAALWVTRTLRDVRHDAFGACFGLRRPWADRHSPPFPWALSLHRRGGPSASHPLVRPPLSLCLPPPPSPPQSPLPSLGRWCPRSPGTFPASLLRVGGGGGHPTSFGGGRGGVKLEGGRKARPAAQNSSQHLHLPERAGRTWGFPSPAAHHDHKARKTPAPSRTGRTPSAARRTTQNRRNADPGPTARLLSVPLPYGHRRP